MSAPVDVLATLDRLQWGLGLRRCPICAGWGCSERGETDYAHTDDCPVPATRAAVAELIEAATEVDRLSRDISAWDDDAAVERAVLRQRAALARVGGAK